MDFLASCPLYIQSGTYLLCRSSSLPVSASISWHQSYITRIWSLNRMQPTLMIMQVHKAWYRQVSLRSQKEGTNENFKKPMITFRSSHEKTSIPRQSLKGCDKHLKKKQAQAQPELPHQCQLPDVPLRFGAEAVRGRSLPPIYRTFGGSTPRILLRLYQTIKRSMFSSIPSDKLTSVLQVPHSEDEPNYRIFRVAYRYQILTSCMLWTASGIMHLKSRRQLLNFFQQRSDDVSVKFDFCLKKDVETNQAFKYLGNLRCILDAKLKQIEYTNCASLLPADLLSQSKGYHFISLQYWLMLLFYVNMHDRLPIQIRIAASFEIYQLSIIEPPLNRQVQRLANKLIIVPILQYGKCSFIFTSVKTHNNNLIYLMEHPQQQQPTKRIEQITGHLTVDNSTPLSLNRAISLQKEHQPADHIDQSEQIAQLASLNPQITNRYTSSIDTFGWSSNHKHIDVDVEGPRMIRRRSSQRYRWYPVCSLLRSLNEYEHDCLDWSIKINNSQHGLLIGICQESKAKSHMFEGWYWAAVGHGHYLIWTGGATYSHDDAQSNNRKQNFKLKAGDVVRVQYNPKTGQLTFSSSNYFLWKFDVQSPPEGDVYRGCVYLNEGDSVDIVTQ